MWNFVKGFTLARLSFYYLIISKPNNTLKIDIQNAFFIAFLNKYFRLIRKIIKCVIVRIVLFMHSGIGTFMTRCLFYLSMIQIHKMIDWFVSIQIDLWDSNWYKTISLMKFCYLFLPSKWLCCFSIRTSHWTHHGYSESLGAKGSQNPVCTETSII